MEMRPSGAALGCVSPPRGAHLQHAAAPGCCAGGVAKYKGAAFMTSKGPCTSKLASGTVG